MERRKQESEVQVAGSLEQAMALVAADSKRRIVVFERSWRAVDRARLRAEQAGLAARLSVHHDSARSFFGSYWNAA
jgi:tRNA1(Val) A37 N6-methylase TrmN6